MSAPASAQVRTFAGRRVAPGATLSGEFTYSVIESDIGSDLGAGERRRERRLRTRLREGLVAERRGRTIADCRIRDLTKTGARLQLDADLPLPKSFLLTEAGTRRAFRATLIWQAGRDAGVRLVPTE